MTLTRYLLTAALAVGLSTIAYAKPKEEPVYAAAATCETADSTPASVVFIDLRPDNVQCAIAAAKRELRVFLVVHDSSVPVQRRGQVVTSVRSDSDALAVAAARLVPEKIIAVGPTSDARDVAELTTIMVRTAAREASDYESRDILPSDIPPNESMPLVVKRFGWRMP